jgi:hypothetical protein
VGSRAIRMLDEAIHAKREGNGETAPDRQWFQPELIVRKSTLKSS